MNIAILQGPFRDPVFCDSLAERLDSCGRVRAGNTVGVRVGDVSPSGVGKRSFGAGLFAADRKRRWIQRVAVCAVGLAWAGC